MIGRLATRHHMQQVILFVVASLFAAGAARAQTVPAGRNAAADSVFARARQLVVSGNGAAGRVLVDSMIAVTTPDTPAYAEALYWRAALAGTSSDAERDYRRIVVEYPESPHAGDALLQLAQLERARGDGAAAATHLDRFLLENPKRPERSRAGLLLVRLLFEQGQVPRACGTLRRTLAEVPDSAVEMRNQLEYFSPRCAAADANPASQLPLPASSPPPGRKAASADTARHDSTAARSSGRYTLQVAAYASKAEAERLAKRLEARGVDARVVGAAKPYRVQIGRYRTRGAAVAAQRELTVKKIAAFVTEVGVGDR